MKTFVLGDQHGSLNAVLQVLERCKFNYETDTLINLGDIVDGWSQSSELVQFWLDFEKKCSKQQIFIKGNHDWWFHNYLLYETHNEFWLNQGGQSTYDSYRKNSKIDINQHISFFENQLDYYIDDNNRLFVHGGFKSNHGVTDEDPIDNLWWDRSLWYETLYYNGFLSLKNIPEKTNRLSLYKEIYIGHSTCFKIDNMKPVTIKNITNLDTGSGWHGKLTIMDIDTKEYWQSDIVKELHKDEKGRQSN